MAFKNINYVIDDERLNRIIDHFRSAFTEAEEFIINLETEERRSMPTLGQKTYGFTKLAHGYMKEHPELMPTFMKPEATDNDMLLTGQLRQVMDVLNPLYEKFEDTYMAVGAEAYLAARVFYKSVKSAAEAGIPGTDIIAKELGIIFKKSSKKE